MGFLHKNASGFKQSHHSLKQSVQRKVDISFVCSFLSVVKVSASDTPHGATAVYSPAARVALLHRQSCVDPRWMHLVFKVSACDHIKQQRFSL